MGFRSQDQGDIFDGLASPQLKLGLALGGRTEATGRKSKSSVSIDSVQAPAAQPVMLMALEDRLEHAHREHDPMWIAPLAVYLQASGNLKLVHILTRSAPVELHPGWLLFFCNKGAQRHNRRGFYWGVPSATSTGFDWGPIFSER